MVLFCFFCWKKSSKKSSLEKIISLRVSALFQGGVGRAIREDGVLLKLDFFKDKVWSE